MDENTADQVDRKEEMESQLKPLSVISKSKTAFCSVEIDKHILVLAWLHLLKLIYSVQPMENLPH